jgi:hypothetical protein
MFLGRLVTFDDESISACPRVFQQGLSNNRVNVYTSFMTRIGALKISLSV